MTVGKLYYQCDNLGSSTVFFVYKGREFIGEFNYMALPAWVDKRELRGFKIVDETNVIIHI